MRIFATCLSILVLLSTGATIISCNNDKAATQVTDGGTISQDSLIKRGEYLVTIMGCDDCHTPRKMGPTGPEPDMSRRLSGHPSDLPIGKINPPDLKTWVLFSPNMTAFAGPWGVSYAANISSDQSGVGGWSEAQFIKAIREGKLKGLDNTRPMLPPMPWPSFKVATDEDLKAIFSFLKSTKPINNIVPAPVAVDAIASLK